MGTFGWVSFAFAAYLVAVRALRYKRLNAVLAKYHNVKNLDARMAQEIVHESLFYDTPMTMLLGTQVALFKVYGIESIASLLLQTGELSSPVRLNKRLADTAILIATALSNPLISPNTTAPTADSRSALAIARINYLHGKHKISNDDFLYNLALFMLEPIECTAKYSWRPHSPLEIQAIFILWTDIGRRMGIQDIWGSFDEMKSWANAYEDQHMHPSDAAEKLSKMALTHMLARVPLANRFPTLGRWATQAVLCILDRRTRRAMRMPDASSTSQMVVAGIFKLRTFIVKHLCLPRRKPSLWVPLDENYPSGRMPAVYLRKAGPWYYPEPTGLALDMQNLLVTLGLKDPQLCPGKQWKSQGYRIEELGPARFENAGHQEVMRAAEAIQGCPVTGLWALS